MNAAEFARRHGRITFLSRTNPKRAAKCRKGLAKRAKAEPITTSGGRIIAYRLPSGVACVRFRYRDESAALLELARIWDAPARAYTPNKSFRCTHCKAHHLAIADSYRGFRHARTHDGA